MSITAEEVKRLAALSRIKLSPEEESSMQTEISSILGYIDQISKADFAADAVEASDRRNIWREDKDVNETGANTEKLLSNAPSREGDYVKVKKIL